jgi:hypothetical protein
MKSHITGVQEMVGREMGDDASKLNLLCNSFQGRETTSHYRNSKGKML